MFLVLGFGLAAIAASARYAYRPESRFVPLLISLGVLTFLSGCFGFVSGVIATIHAVSKLGEERPLITLIGLGESLNNLGWAFALMSIATLLTVVGAARLARQMAATPRTA